MNEEINMPQTDEIVEPDVGLTPEEEQDLLIKSYTEELKEKKKEELDNLKVEVYSVPMDADRTAISNMNAVGTIANWKFNQAVGSTLIQMSQDPDLDDVSKAMVASLGSIFQNIYDAVYKDNKVPWKGADNKVHNIQAETILVALEKSMQELAKVIGVK